MRGGGVLENICTGMLKLDSECWPSLYLCTEKNKQTNKKQKTKQNKKKKTPDQ